MASESDLIALLQLNGVPGIGPIHLARLVERFGSAAEVLTRSRGDLQQVERIGPTLAKAITDPKGEARAVEELARAREHGITLVTADSPEYPPLLKAIPDPPVILYVRGALRPADGVGLAIVGARNVSYYGRDQGRRFGTVIAGAGFTVVSGFARGVDTAAHEGALAAGGRTVAVIGSGLLELYPPENAALAEEVAERGALVSEFPLTVAPAKENFPRRNRIIAGMTLGTLVIEAGKRSGSLITARLAGEYGREVFAVPGPIDRERSRGCHALIKDGARLVEDLDDLLAELGPIGDRLTATDAATRKRGAELFGDADDAPSSPSLVEPSVPLSDDERAVFALLSDEPQNIDAMIARSGLELPQLTAMLTTLEMKRQARQLAGQHFIRAPRD